ncbi:MAG: DNA mismatch repair protein [Chitinophagaceae bacterium]|nr:DNA mismatch repair protein [Chitinophagaceae bacterium]
MSFITDKQTLDDLNIFGKRGKASIYSIFNRAHTQGGAEQLERLFSYPLSDATAINQRSRIIRFFQERAQTFPFKSEYFDAIEQYLGNTDTRSQLTRENNTLERKLRGLVGSDTAYQQLSKGIASLIAMLQQLQDQINKWKADKGIGPYLPEVTAMQRILQTEGWEPVFTRPAGGKLSYEENAAFDKLLRYQHIEKVKRLLQHIYLLDVYVSVAQVATERRFVFPEAVEEDGNSIDLIDMYHPQLEKPVSNTIRITPDSNVIFLTGANMAGKSTFMKTLGVALYLAHMGFPVPAASMRFSVKDGMFTTINLADSLNMGYSHFYAEVIRVKKVAQQLKQGKRIFVIFDELFRGTNVKDAYEATVAITQSFAAKRQSTFLISTHIMEAGETLQQQLTNINFVYLPTRMEHQKAVYTYTLEQGISADRHGMMIINNEGILEILKSGITKN